MAAAPFTEKELAAAFFYLRAHPAFAELMPPPRTIRVDWFFMAAIAQEVQERREKQPDATLQVLVGKVVREKIPPTSKPRRTLGMAYRNGIMKMLSDRAHMQVSQKSRRKRGNRNKPMMEDNGQVILI